jgi:surfeit locus 1 family protein
MRWLLIAITACVATAITISLGFWQLRRAAQKEALAAQIHAGGATRSVEGMTWLSGDVTGALLHQTVRVSGDWIADKTVFLDNRQMQAKVGFYVVTPLRLEGTNTVVMVQRGWAPRNFMERNRVPAVETESGTVELTGRIALPPSKLYEPGTASTGLIRQNLDLQSFRQETGLALRTDFSIVQTGAASEGLLRDWPMINLGVEKHYGYAAQWFALAALIVILFVWYQLRPLFVSSKDPSTHV